MEFKDVKIKYLSFGSPLMDCIGDVSNEFLEKYNIQLDTTIHKNLKDVSFFTDFLMNVNVTNVPGGCQFNAMRVFNWMLDKDNTDIVAFLGSVGDDEYYGNVYQDLLISENIVPIFQSIEGETTGLCLVVCNKRDRAHITDLGASIKISKEFVERHWNKFKDVKLIYTELFIVKHQKEICYKLAELGLKDSIIYGFNLPASFFLSTFRDDIENLIECADIIFSNFNESKDFLKNYFEKRGINDINVDNLTALEVAEKIAETPKKNKNKKRVVVVTAGPEPAACVEYDHKNNMITQELYCEVKFVSKEKIVDTNGAGDSFAGGFLSQYIKGKSLYKCMKAGHWAAAFIIQRRGCQIPQDVHYPGDEEDEVEEKNFIDTGKKNIEIEDKNIESEDKNIETGEPTKDNK